jgi:hypothetical protein
VHKGCRNGRLSGRLRARHALGLRAFGVRQSGLDAPQHVLRIPDPIHGPGAVNVPPESPERFKLNDFPIASGFRFGIDLAVA